MNQDERRQRIEAFRQRQSHPEVPGTWKTMERMGLRTLGPEWYHLVAGDRKKRKGVYEPSEADKSLVKTWMDRVRREEQMTPVEREEARARRQHAFIQSDLEEDLSCGNPDICYRCGDAGQVVDSVLEHQYDPRRNAQVLRCRSFVAFCECPAGKSKIEAIRPEQKKRTPKTKRQKPFQLTGGKA